MKKICMLTLIFIFAFPVYLLSFEDLGKEVCSKFLEGYLKKDSEVMMQSLVLPSEFFNEVVKYEAKKGGVSEKKIKKDIAQFLKVQKEVFEDCILSYLPISGYAEIKDVPKERLQRIFYLDILNDEERFYFQDRLSCRKYLFMTITDSYKKRYCYMEVCKVKEYSKPWIDRFAIFGSPDDTNLEALSCFMEKIKLLLEKAKPSQ
ncbi:MAG: hypothetical protein H0Z16_07860 [Thermodesulfobacterium sp.]|nr:hypothetical protein [Thermodesulfobacterium sp.]